MHSAFVFTFRMLRCLNHVYKFIFAFPSQYVYFSEHLSEKYHHHQIESIELSLYCYIFPGLRAWGSIPSYAVRFICISQEGGFCVFYYCTVLGWVHRVHTDPMAVLVCLHITVPNYHHYGDISEGIGVLKCLSGTFCLKCVSKIKSILSIIFDAIYWAVPMQLTHCSYNDYENTRASCYYHNQIGSMTHSPFSRVRSCNNGMRCISFIFLSVCAVVKRGKYLHNIYRHKTNHPLINTKSIMAEAGNLTSHLFRNE